MQKHIKNYTQTYNIGEQDFVLCERCKFKQATDIHHIIYRSEKPKHELLDHPVNLIGLCRECHDYFHQSKNNRKELVKIRKLDIIFDLWPEKTS